MATDMYRVEKLVVVSPHLPWVVLRYDHEGGVAKVAAFRSESDAQDWANDMEATQP